MKKLFKKILNLILPNRCLTCNVIISQDALFCSDHFKELQFITEPKCKICSYPFEYSIDSKQNLICAPCLTKKPFFDDSITVFRYNEVLKKAILEMKYYDNNLLAKRFAQILIKKIAPIASNYDFLVAVPLHKKRLKERKFNQAVLICKFLKKEFPHFKFYPDLLIRTKFTKTQTSLNKKQREKNLQNIFEIKEKYCQKIIGKNILLIDDVITTGNTLNGCAKILKKVKSKKITIVTIAKTVF